METLGEHKCRKDWSDTLDKQYFREYLNDVYRAQTETSGPNHEGRETHYVFNAMFGGAKNAEMNKVKALWIAEKHTLKQIWFKRF